MQTIESSPIVGNSDLVSNSVTADQIIAAHNEAFELGKTLMRTGNAFVVQAAKVGGLLIAKKEQLGHGHFLPWLAENIKEFSYDTANDYMKAHRYLERAPNLDTSSLRSVLDLRQAVGMLEDKPAASTEERSKPPFVIRFNLDPVQWDEYQRRDFAKQTEPGMLACRNECLERLGVSNAA